MGDYIVRRDTVGKDDDYDLYEYYELDGDEYELLKAELIDTENERPYLYHVETAGKNLLRSLSSSVSDWAEIKLGNWKFWFRGPSGNPALRVISHSDDVSAEYVFMSPKEYENTFGA